MHGVSYVEQDRAVGPKGSDEERVPRFTFCTVNRARQMEEKDYFTVRLLLSCSAV